MNVRQINKQLQMYTTVVVFKIYVDFTPAHNMWQQILDSSFQFHFVMMKESC